MSNTPSIRLDAISAIYPGLSINKKRKKYNKGFSSKEKKEAVRYAKNNSIDSAAERSKVTSQTIRNWMREYPEVLKKSDNGKSKKL